MIGGNVQRQLHRIYCIMFKSTHKSYLRIACTTINNDDKIFLRETWSSQKRDGWTIHFRRVSFRRISSNSLAMWICRMCSLSDLLCFDQTNANIQISFPIHIICSKSGYFIYVHFCPSSKSSVNLQGFTLLIFVLVEDILRLLDMYVPHLAFVSKRCLSIPLNWC